MASKAKYRIRNSKEYNKSLIQRGSITVWFSEDAIDKWHATPTGKRGRPATYSDDAILTALLIRFVFHLPLRALEGFLSSLVSVMNLCIYTPSYSQICRRAQLLGFGFVAQFTTEPLRSVRGAYDRAMCYRANFDHGSSLIVPPQRNARYRMNAPEYLEERNKVVLEIRGLGGDDDARTLWKKLKGYHRRSLAETGMYRFKTLFGSDLKSRVFQGQQAEAYVKSKALNIMTNLGMPQSEKIAA